MDYKKLINDIQAKNPALPVVIGVNGYRKNQVAEIYFKQVYRKEYIKKITLIIMLVSSWYDVHVLYEAHGDEVKRKYQIYNDQVFELREEKQVRDLKGLIAEAMSDKPARLRMIMEDKKVKAQFVLDIQNDESIKLYQLSGDVLEYLTCEFDKQGLTLCQSK